jgi:hypothetical protein
VVRSSGIPGIFTSLAALRFNFVNKNEIGRDGYAPRGNDLGRR